MEFLSWLFFCLSPFALFCSEDGNGIVLCIVFLVLGAVCKWIDNGGLKPKVKVEPKDWWEANYKLNMSQGRGHEASKNIADWTTRVNYLPMPTEGEKERVARSIGVVTPQMRYDEEDRWNRIQVEKYRLMKELYEKYNKKVFRSEDFVSWTKNIGRYCLPYTYIEYSMMVLKRFIRVQKWNKDPWTATISKEEKDIAKKWIEEYEERLLREVNDYIENGVSMPTITKHKDRGGWAVYSDYDVKYGFCKEIIIKR